MASKVERNIDREKLQWQLGQNTGLPLTQAELFWPES